MNPLSQPDSPLVLVVDDDRSLRTLLRFAMEEEGYQVAEANNGENCLAEFARLKPDIVLLDAVMPVMDGFSCCSQLRTLSSAAHTPVLMITVLDDQESVDQAFAVGATDYVTKPIHWAVLRQRVTRLLEASRSVIQVQQVTEALQKQIQRERLFREIAQRLTQASTLEDILNPSVQEILEFLKVDRVSLNHINGSFITPSASDGGTSVFKGSLKDSDWEMEYAQEFKAGRVVAISDIQQEGVPACVSKCLEPLNIKSALMVPIFIRGEWWGLLEAAHSDSRDWEAEMVDVLVDVANLMAIAIGYSC
ncbi:response regulator [Allocoleopsis sp.]|uniref:response regulator n=1 Tax=Allocoleopsis sp. TaxID=3088169 RepID=UPI002FD3B6AC